MDIRGKVALITGGSTGIGGAIDLALAREGAYVAVNGSRSEEEARATAQAMRELGVSACAIRFCDRPDDHPGWR